MPTSLRVGLIVVAAVVVIGPIGYMLIGHLGAFDAIYSSRSRSGLAIERGGAAILGDATSDDVLRRAGIARASTVISAVASDSDNLVIALSAKSLNPDVRVVAREIDEGIERKLYRAGADRVVAPQSLGGQRLAALALKPEVTEFVDLVIALGSSDQLDAFGRLVEA